MALSNFTAGTVVTTAQLNAMVAAINTNTNGFADSGWLTDMTAGTGFSIYGNSAMVRIDTNSIIVTGTMQVTTAPTAALTTDVLFLNWGGTSSGYMANVKAGCCGTFVGSGGATGMVSINSTGIYISYRTANPAASSYFRFNCAWLQT